MKRLPIAWTCRAALLAAAAATVGCGAVRVDGSPSWFSPGVGTHAPAAPLAFVSTEAVPGSLTGVAIAPGRELVIESRDDDSFGFGQLLHDAVGPFTAQVTLGVDSPVGLVGGWSFAGIEMDRPPDSIPLQFFFVGASWEPTINGFQGFASMTGGVNIGTPQPVPNTTQIDLRMEQTATDLTLSVRATPITADAEGGWLVIHTGAIPAPATPFNLALGAANLNDGGSFAFRNLAAVGATLGGTVEQPILNAVFAAKTEGASARAALAAASPDLAAASVDLQDALNALDAATSGLEAAILAGTLQVETLGEKASKAIGKARKSVVKAKATADVGDPEKAEKAIKAVDKADSSETAAMANLFGFGAKKGSQVPVVFSGP